jgi:hypothetical protein
MWGILREFYFRQAYVCSMGLIVVYSVIVLRLQARYKVCRRRTTDALQSRAVVRRASAQTYHSSTLHLSKHNNYQIFNLFSPYLSPDQRLDNG